ncbi:MAG: peptidase M28 [Elusimicrobia bacterium RIFOXYB2_FULL_48_7]|nr:MAG: peptidase M28 [Elusimicrobia bacterium RIFOXYB2_FULL_48_7]
MPVDKNSLYSTVKYLASLNPPRNYRNISSLNKAAAYIERSFRESGYTPEIQTFKQEFRLSKDEFKNIICSLGPPDAERIIVGAHYDVFGDQPGADDNASGIAGLLELARILKIQNPALKYRVDFAAYSLEEPPFFRTDSMGSAVHAKSLFDSGKKIKAMICLEMIGYYSESRGTQGFPMFIMKLFYPSRGNFIAVVGNSGQGKLIRQVKKNMKTGPGMGVESLSAPSWLPGTDFSDHLNYWKYGYKAVMVTDTAFFRNPNYHNSTDTIETLNFDKMSEVVKGIYQAIVNLE